MLALTEFPFQLDTGTAINVRGRASNTVGDGSWSQINNQIQVITSPGQIGTPKVEEVNS